MGEIFAPVERRAERLQFLPAQFVIQLGWIAALHASERSFRKCSLDLHDSLCFGRGGFWLIAQQLEHLLDVDRIFLRSEERRVGKECRSRWPTDDEKKRRK